MSEIAGFRVGYGRYFTAMAVALIVLAALILLTPTTVDGQINPFFAEDGPVELLSALGYIACALLIVARGGVDFAWNKAFGIIVVLLFLASRELDFHVRFTTMGVMKLDFYFSSQVPLIEKMLALLVLGIVALAVMSVIRLYGRAFLAGLRRLEPTSVAVAVSVLMVVLSKSIDGMDRKLADFGITLSNDRVFQFLKVEETLELGVPVFAILAVMAYFGMRSHGEPM